MKALVLGLLIGLAVGYWHGYGDGSAGKESIAARVLDRFGASKVRSAAEQQERREKEASTP